MKKIISIFSGLLEPKKPKIPSRLNAFYARFPKLYMEQHAGGFDFGRPFLGELPRKVLDIIMDGLPIESQAMMQLVCRSLNKRLQGRHVDGRKMGTCSLTRKKLLLLLERDNPYPDCILCMWCGKFHKPQISSEPWCDTRGCAVWTHPNFDLRKQSFLGVPPYLLTTVHFNLVKAIMKSHRTQAPAIYTPDLLASSRTMLSERGIRVQIKDEAKIVNGSLLLKTQILVWKPETTLTCGDAPEALCLWKLFHEKREYLRACEHEMYTSYAGTSSFRFLLCPYECRLDGSHARLANDHKRHECTWKHAQPCKCMFAPPWGKAYACRLCYTDFAVSFQKVTASRNGSAETSKVLVFTTWKDLGKGQWLADPKWQSHLAAKKQQGSPGFIRGELASVYKAYEG